MFEVENLLLFIVAGLLLNISPGPDMLYVATRSTHQGRAAGIVSALGIGAGALVHTAAAALGLSTILMYSSLAFSIIKWVGALYLIYLGLRAILNAGQPLVAQRYGDASLPQIFRQAVTVNVLNPKVAIFFISFLPQFTRPEAGSLTAQIILLGTVFNVNGTLVNIAVALFFGTAGNWLMQRPVARRVQGYITGTIFAGLGLHLALSDNG